MYLHGQAYPISLWSTFSPLNAPASGGTLMLVRPNIASGGGLGVLACDLSELLQLTSYDLA